MRMKRLHNNVDQKQEALSEDIGDLCEAMLTMAGAEINIDEAFGLLEATWLWTAWLHDDAWLESTLDQLWWNWIVAPQSCQKRPEFAREMGPQCSRSLLPIP